MTRSDGSGKPNGSASSGCIPGPDVSKISDLTAERVEHVFLHIPVLNQSTESPDVFVPTSRFCSFGSTWNSKVSASAKALNPTCSGRYLTLDVTSLFTNRTEHSLIYSEGLILKKPRGNDPFIAISLLGRFDEFIKIYKI